MVQVILYQANRQADQSRCPPWPDQMPLVMLTYDRWLDEGMHPRDVDRLSRAELFWLPLIRAAKREAGRQLARED